MLNRLSMVGIVCPGIRSDEAESGAVHPSYRT